MSVEQFKADLREIINRTADSYEAREAAAALMQVVYSRFTRNLHVIPRKDEARKIYLAALTALDNGKNDIEE